MTHAPLQKTLKQSIVCRGIGLHSGKPVAMRLSPAAPFTGIIFRRVDGAYPVELPALWHRVQPSSLCTTIAEGDSRLATIEHVMAALAGCGVDNAIIDVDGAEVPIMDGSATPFVFLLQCAGIVEQNAPRSYIRVLRPVEVSDGDKKIRIEPANTFKITCSIDFPDQAIGKQTSTYTLREQSFAKSIAKARTFTRLAEVNAMRAHGFALGGSLDNAVVVDNARVLNNDGLRYSNECVRHKILDAIGDLYLAGAPLLGKVYAHKSGHALNYKLLATLMADTSAWKEETLFAPSKARVAARPMPEPVAAAAY